MSKSKDVISWRRRTKSRLVALLGGECNYCNTVYHDEAYDIHHIVENDKGFGFGAIMAHPQAWDTLVTEAKKCMLLCANCHRQLHAGHIDIEDIAAAYDERFEDSSNTMLVVYGGMMVTILLDEYDKSVMSLSEHSRTEKKKRDGGTCKICGAETSRYSSRCAQCASVARRVIEWPGDNDLYIMMEQYKWNYSAAGKHLGVSHNAVRNHIRRTNEGVWCNGSILDC